MDRLDKFLQNTLIPENTHEKRREGHQEYVGINSLSHYYRTRGDLEKAALCSEGKHKNTLIGSIPMTQIIEGSDTLDMQMTSFSDI